MVPGMGESAGGEKKYSSLSREAIVEVYGFVSRGLQPSKPGVNSFKRQPEAFISSAKESYLGS